MSEFKFGKNTHGVTRFIHEPANGLIVTFNPGSFIEIEIGSEKIQMLYWARKGNKAQMVLRAPKSIKIGKFPNKRVKSEGSSDE